MWFSHVFKKQIADAILIKFVCKNCKNEQRAKKSLFRIKNEEILQFPNASKDQFNSMN